MKTKEIIIKPSISPNVFEIGKEIYVLKKEIIKKGHIEKLIFEKTSKKKYKKELDIVVDSILKKGDLDMKAVLRQALLELSRDDLKVIKKKLMEGLKPKKRKGCLYLEIGDKEIPIFTKVGFIRG